MCEWRRRMLGISSIPMRLLTVDLFYFQNTHLENIHGIANYKIAIFQGTILGNIHGFGNYRFIIFFQRIHLG